MTREIEPRAAFRTPARNSGTSVPAFANTIVRGCIAAAALAATITLALAATNPFSVLYAFCRQTNCSDGEQPDSTPVADNSGNFYSTTDYGGSNNCPYGCGTIFKLAPDGTETVLHSFCAKDSSCPDGELPYSPLILDNSGNLYGTTLLGGANGQGTVFKLAPDGKETVLYSFCSRNGCADGAGPSGGVTMDRRGSLYGTTGGGGGTACMGGCGTVFKLRPDGKEKVLYNFCSQDGCTDGFHPNGGLIRGRGGNLYGTTLDGGANEANCSYLGQLFCGTVFKIGPTGTETVLHSFCAEARCPDGAGPQSGVVMDKDGNLYGTASAGGNLSQSCPNAGGGVGWCGVVFKVKPDSTESVLYAFCAQANCTDGAYPLADVALKSTKSGITLYGTAEFGGAQGANGAGVVFSLSGGTETVLHSFCSRANCADGVEPQSGVIMDGGSLVGAAWQGGKYGGGTVYKLELAGGRAVRYGNCPCSTRFAASLDTRVTVRPAQLH